MDAIPVGAALHRPGLAVDRVSRHIAPMNYPHTQLLIDGQWRDSHDRRTLPVVNPANGKEIGRVAHAGIPDLDAALHAAEAGFHIWRDVVPIERSKIMRRAAGLMRERAEATAHILTQEQGKPLAEARGECLAAAEILDWFADEGLRVYGRLVPARSVSTQQWVLKDPVGPVAVFTPWNFPINQVVRKAAAALATGCSIIVKAAEETPAAPAALIRALVDAGVPAGVIALVYGNPGEISKYLIPHPVIRKISFTGSTVVGKQLAALAGHHMKRATMELGGHAPVIVAEDADLELAIRVSASAKFRNAGQVCISPTRFLVHESLIREFSQGFAQYAAALRVGDGLAPDTQMGPLANPRRVAAMNEFLEDALRHGAQVLAGGKRIGEHGNFFAPTVLGEVAPAAKVFNDEPFGPMAALQSFNRLEDAITEANRLSFGLAGYAFTRSIKVASLLTRRVEVGMLWINQPATPSAELPFGGIKDSGYGTEGGWEALEPYLNTRSVSMFVG
jgi:succinate-semialdehyde dehydrogenase/glutarate-semialdehyde dehydrogenase